VSSDPEAAFAGASRYPTFTIGSDPACDIVLADETVAALHAQIEWLPDGLLRLSDCGQGAATKVVHKGEARAVRRGMIASDDGVRLGDIEMSAAELIEAIRLKHPSLDWPPSPAPLTPTPTPAPAAKATPAPRPTPTPQPAPTPLGAPRREPSGDAQPQAQSLSCPRCAAPTDSLKRFRLHQWLVFIWIGWWTRTAEYTACPACMRKILLERTLVNIPTANLIWPIVLVTNAICFARTFGRGHSKKVRDLLA
jgi:hypothetical protein